MARTEGKREEPRKRPTAKPAPKRPALPTVEDARQSSGLGRKVLFGGLGVIVLAVITALSFQLANEEDPADTLPDVSVNLSGDALPPFADPSNDTGVGLTAAEVTSVDFAGEAATISHDGTPKLILFLAHWCPHCQREVPALQSWIDENGVPEGVDFVSVATAISDARPNYPPNAWLDREGWTQRVVVDDTIGSIASSYGLQAFPYYVILDGNGTVVQRISGEQDPAVVGTLLQALSVLEAG